MSRFPEGPIAISALIALAVWLFVCLPLLYSPGVHIPHGLFEVKAGEFLIFAATLALWWATRRLVKGADKTAERQLRAYVMIDSVNLTNLAVGGNPEAHITFKNSGQTPASEMTHWARLGFLQFPTPSGSFPQKPQRILPASTLAPGGKVTITTGINQPLNPVTLAALQSSHALYLVGEIRYRDAFGEQRETDFVLFCTGPMVAAGTMASFETGNRIT